MEYIFNKKIDDRLLKEIKQQIPEFDGKNGWFISSNNNLIFNFKVKLSVEKENKLKNIINNWVYKKPETIVEKKKRLKLNLTSANSIVDIKKIIGELI